jgi:hypothetical protein
MAGRQRNALVVGAVFQRIADLNRGHLLRGHAKQQRADSVCQARGGVIGHSNELRDFTAFFGWHLNHGRENTNCFPQPSNISMQDVALLNSLLKVCESFVERLAVFIGSHNL